MPFFTHQSARNGKELGLIMRPLGHGDKAKCDFFTL